MPLNGRSGTDGSATSSFERNGIFTGPILGNELQPVSDAKDNTVADVKNMIFFIFQIRTNLRSALRVTPMTARFGVTLGLSPTLTIVVLLRGSQSPSRRVAVASHSGHSRGRG